MIRIFVVTFAAVLALAALVMALAPSGDSASTSTTSGKNASSQKHESREGTSNAKGIDCPSCTLPSP